MVILMIAGNPVSVVEAVGKKIVAVDHYETTVRQRKVGSITTNTKSLRIREGIRLREAMWILLLTKGEDSPDRFEAFRQYIFRQLRGLYRQDKIEALDIYQKYFSEEPFTPKEIHVPCYTFLYRLLGFKQTESLIQFLLSFRK